ncbi:hypothetical protein ACIRJO_30685 [Streptomyces sp. NPDC102394]|uniref:hypothetical protein n=1 Tax=Streptomyces sp. NPDC102394 TaxID=3366167 RepID=UPI003820B4B6
MTWPAALPAAALRVMRSAAGRRALQVMVLVGGLFALGFLCGEQAHAADEAPGTSSSAPGPVVGRLVTAPAALVDALAAAPGRLEVGTPGKPHPHAPAGHGRPGDSARPEPSDPAQSRPKPKPKPAPPADADRAGSTDPAGSGTPASTPPARSTAEVVPALGSVVGDVVQSVDATVLRPVGDLVVTVTGGLAEATAPITGLPQLPPLPSVPELPGTPSLPGLPSVPGQTLPAPAPVTQPGGPGHAAVAGGASGERRSAARGATYGPRSGEVGGTAHAPARGDGRRTADGAGYAPLPQAPGGDPTGVLSNRSAVDSGTPRHSDAQAVALGHRAPQRMLSGVAARAHGDATRDRHRDIPVSPA